MSLGILIKAPEGIVLAAESRVTLTVENIQKQEKIHSTFDNATKVLSFNIPHDKFGAVTYGQAAIGFRTAQSFIPEFESDLKNNKKDKLTVLEFANELSSFFNERWKATVPQNYKGPNMVFNVAGFDDNEAYGRVYNFEIPQKPTPIEQHPPTNGQHQFGISWGGQREIVERLMLGYDSRLLKILQDGKIITADKIPQIQGMLRQISLQATIQFMPLQDCINLALLFIRTTIEAQNLTVGLRGCGGPIDVAIITKNNSLNFVQKKDIVGEVKKV